MIYLPLGKLQLALDTVGIALILLALLLILVSVWQVIRRHFSSAKWLASLCALLIAAQVFRGTMAPEESWQIMLASVQESSGPERERRVQDLREGWHYGEMRAITWYKVAKAWGVCHALWHESNCRTPAGPYEAMGIAREKLEELSRSAIGSAATQ